MLDINAIRQQLAEHLASTASHRHSLDAAVMHVVQIAYRQGLEDRTADLADRIARAPAAIMDTRDALGICAPTEEDFPALYALRGKRVRLVLDDDGGNR